MLVYTSLLRRIPKHPRPSICSRRGLRENGQPRVCIRTHVRTHVPACRVQAFASTAAAYRRGRGINGHPEVIFESFMRGGSDLGKRKAKATCGAYMAFHVLLSVCHSYCRKCWRDRGCVCVARVIVSQPVCRPHVPQDHLRLQRVLGKQTCLREVAERRLVRGTIIPAARSAVGPPCDRRAVPELG